MSIAFCPGHITCFFQPCRVDDAGKSGSRGAGIRLSLGSTVTVEERSDTRVTITIDGKESTAAVTRNVVKFLAPGRGFDIFVENDLPVSQGFGMSASGSVAAAFSICDLMESEKDPFYAAHCAEVMAGGGLGDVSAIHCKGHQPVRLEPGLPPIGNVIDAGVIPGNLTLIVTGARLSTTSVLSDKIIYDKMSEVGYNLVKKYVENPSLDILFQYSRYFSSNCGLESEDVTSALNKLSPYGPAGMCMLGHSIFTTLSEDEVKDILGDDVCTYSCSSSDVMPALIRKG